MSPQGLEGSLRWWQFTHITPHLPGTGSLPSIKGRENAEAEKCLQSVTMVCSLDQDRRIECADTCPSTLLRPTACNTEH